MYQLQCECPQIYQTDIVAYILVKCVFNGTTIQNSAYALHNFINLELVNIYFLKISHFVTMQKCCTGYQSLVISYSVLESLSLSHTGCARIKWVKKWYHVLPYSEKELKSESMLMTIRHVRGGSARGGKQVHENVAMAIFA